MFEIERKFRLSAAEAEQLQTKLVSKYGPGEKLTQKDEHFLFKQTSFSQHVTGEPIVRIRKSGDKYYFTYKHTVLESGNRVEYETSISDPASMRAALIAMGWHGVIQIEKVRLHFHASGVTYDLDDVKRLGHYLEIEIVSEKDSDAESTLVAIAKDLGIPASRLERRNYGALFQEKHNA